MKMPPLLADFTHARPCKPFCEKYLTLPELEDTLAPVQDGKLIHTGQVFATMSSDEFKKRQTLSKKFIFNSVCLFVQYVLYMNFL